MDKTENLNYIEAHQALANGKCVQDDNEHIYKATDGWIHHWNSAVNYWGDWRSFLDPDDAPFRIVPDPSVEKKSLTFDEAVARLRVRKVVKVALSSELCNYASRDVLFDDLNGNALLWLVAAESKGWPILQEEN